MHIPTLREDPAEAGAPSHRLLLRAGYIRQLMAGHYSLLPLAVRVRLKVIGIIREEMNRIGAQEILMPVMHPAELWQRSGRWDVMGDEMFRLKDRKGAALALGMTHEEVVSTLAAELNSYRELPQMWYQFQTKLRDEPRPKAGLMRTREFTMKDSYSFDLDAAGLDQSFLAHRDAYVRIFDRLGVEYVVVKATSGAMGGSASEEFLAVAETGEDTFVRSTGSTYAANVEAVVTTAPPAQPIDGKPEAKVHDTPNTPTIATLVDFFNNAGLGREFTAADTLKNVLLKTRRPGEEKWELLAVGVPGDREVDQKRLEAALEPAEVALLDEADFAANPFLVKGYIGPKALLDNGVRYLVDPRVVTGTSWITGADQAGRHVTDLVAGRDFVPNGTIDVAEVREGDASPDGQGTLVAARGIEIGHVFQLGRKYADAFGLDALGPDSKPIRITMGSYGVGVSRLVAVIAEQYFDDRGLTWPRIVAPADVHMVIAGKDETVRAGAEKLAGDLAAAGIEVLLDDRTASPGVKFADAELIGVPTIVVVGRGLASGVVEVKDRVTGERGDVPVDEAVAHVVGLVRG